jgi:hypothetical protein
VIRRAPVLARAFGWTLVGGLAACGGDPPVPPRPPGMPPAPYPATAKPDIPMALLEGLAAPRHPGDGGGRAWIDWPDGEPVPHLAGASGRWTLVFEAGPAGIAEGGSVFFQVPPFWGWSTPQVAYPGRPGHVELSTDVPGLTWNAETVDAQLLRVTFEERGLRAGERLRLTYGAGARGALGDRFAEACSRFVFAVDADGDGVRATLEEDPCVEVLARPASQWLATWDSTLKPGAQGRLVVAALDDRGDLAADFVGEVELVGAPEAWELPERLIFEAEHGGRRELRFTCGDSGTYRITVRSPEADATGLAPCDSNPLRVSTAPRLLWLDLHGHSSLSDGTGSPEDYFDYAHRVARLDAAALTDHDHWGFRPLDRHPELWSRIRAAAADARAPGEFLALHGFEWTSWIYGHRHVVHFDLNGPLYSSLDERFDEPPELWAALAQWPALSVPHHPAGGPVAIDWSFDPPPAIEPLAEVVSVHGSSADAADPRRIYSSVPGHFVYDALSRGKVYGLIGSGDSHDGHPGLPQLAGPCGGLAAVLCEELDPDALLEALRARRTYATTGARILLRGNLAGHPMGSAVPRAERTTEKPLVFEVVGTAPIESLDLLGPTGVLASIEGQGQLELRGVLPLPEDFEEPWLSLRVVQRDGERAWGSPFRFPAE